MPSQVPDWLYFLRPVSLEAHIPCLMDALDCPVSRREIRAWLGLAVISEGDERFSPRPPCSSRTRQPKRPAVCSQNQTPNSQLLPSCQIMNSLDATVEGD